ncbi:MAG: hypothetical protein FWF73_05915 [Spirochaetes bacterium]|nr:hypothetical protein [Spirochaetota bacterium]
MAKNDKTEYKIGEFLTKNNIINQHQLNDALELQTFNKERLLGEILVTMGYISKEKLIMSLEMYMMTTNSDKIGINEWLDQEEIDLIIKKLEASKLKSS